MHGYSLRSRGWPPPDSEDHAATGLLPDCDENIVLRTGGDGPVGILSARPPLKKIKATAAHVIMVYSDCDPFGLSDLTDLEELERTSMPPESKSGERQHRGKRRRTEETEQKQIRVGRIRLARKAVVTAQMKANTVLLENFQMEKAIHYTMFRDTSKVVSEEKTATVLDGDTPQRVVSADGYDVLYRIPGACRGKSLDFVSDLCHEWGRLAKIKKTAANDKKGCYKKMRGALAGTTRLCTLWHAIGHKCDDPTPAADMLHNGKTFRAAVDAISGLDMVSAYAMAALEVIDPTQHSLLETLWKKTCERENVQKLFDSINGGLAYEGREVVFNRESLRHWDQHDPDWAWANILYFGTFKRAQLRFPQLNVTVMLYPGDMVFFRGRNLCHDAPAWGSGTRNFLVHFTHKHMWDYMGMTCASQKAVNVDM